MEIKRGQNIIEHEDEIFSRPKKTWFTTEKSKSEASSTPFRPSLLLSICR